MSDTITIRRGDLTNLQERAKKLAMEKAHLQLIIKLMSRVSSAHGLDNTIENILRHVLDVIGGTNLVLYYKIDDDVFYWDVYGTKMRIDEIDDVLVKRVFETSEPIEYEHDFKDTKMITPEFTKAYTWVFPLLVGPEFIGVFKMENLHISTRELCEQLPIFFNYSALILKHEILGHSKLKEAYDQLSEANADLTKEIDERMRAQEALMLSESNVQRTHRISAPNGL